LLTRLGYYADKAVEWGWLAVAVFAPLYFNVYSSRVFEPDKITTIRSIVLLMLVAWLIKLGESGWRGAVQSGATTRSGKAAAAATSVVETAGPSWLGVLRVPIVIAILIYALTYLISTIFTVTPDASIFGSYQRLQGFYSQMSYMMLGILVMANMRTRVQVDRLINFMLMTSLPVALYGVLQALRLDPLPWAGDTATRVSSSMGNAIFVAAWLIMVVPLAIYRLVISVSSAVAVRRVDAEAARSLESDYSRNRPSRRPRPADYPSYGWAVVANSIGIIIASMMLFLMALRMMAGLPYPDARTGWVLPAALIFFCFAVGAIEWLGSRRDDPRQVGVFLPIVGTLVFFTSFLALVLTWALDNTTRPGEILLNLGFDGTGLLWTLFFFLLWASLSAAAYAFAGREREEAYGEDRHQDRGIVRLFLIVGYSFLILAQLVCIYLTQSRGPWLGLGAGLVVFMVAMWLVGRSRGVRWMTWVGGVASALVLVMALFVAALNIPNSPLQGLSNLPVFGRGIERLSTLTRTEDGTGKVRELIWEGATSLILSDPARALIGWGPESMYVAYSRFYPAALGQVELRNATPDRSHNVEFDQMVTMGMFGLLAYFFLMATFFYFGIRVLKRATNTRDRIFAIALLAAIASHFIEIQTGIQIASTWSYFYLMIGMLVAFGYYITGYLRPAEQTAQSLDGYADGNGNASAEMVAASRGDAVEARPVAAAVGASGRASATMQTTNGKSTSGQARRSKASQPIQQPQGRGSGGSRGGSGGGQQSEGRRRQPAMQYNTQRGGTSTEWFRNPILLPLYALALLVALFVVFSVNSASVRADTLFKQAQAYDNASRYFTQQDTAAGTILPGSLQFYEEAISLQPNQDYYYLFEGRTWLEAAKAVDTETCTGPNNQNPVPCNQRVRPARVYSSDTTQAATEKKAEKLFRLQTSEQILTHAHELSPLNTDHYANLGRLYLYWADPSGGDDPKKNPLAVQWMEQAVQHTPGNAQLWDELGVAYTRDNQFERGIETLNHSQYEVDSTYARTPFIKAQLYQERAVNVENALKAGKPLPTDGETDWGKLVLESGKAYSDTVGLDITQYMDDQASPRIGLLLEGTNPFTQTNTQLPPDQLHNILTDTLKLAFTNVISKSEGQLTDFLKGQGVTVPDGPTVPDTILQSLLNNPSWADTSAQTWLDANLQTYTTNAAMAHYGLGLCYQALGDKDKARAEYTRARVLKPTYNEPQQALQGLQ
jgi:tetratricopeptide (TPR) repeat protein